MSQSVILIYIDAGTFGGASRLMRAIAQELPPAQYQMRAVMGVEVAEDAHLFDNAVLFVMPGGADKPYCAALNGQGNKRIKDFVLGGGAYLGVCAGGYYGCREIAYHKGRIDEICEPRELSFVDACATGSLPELTNGLLYDESPRSAAAPLIILADGTVAHVHYNGGCRFDFARPDAARVVAIYKQIEGTPPAIVTARCGLGQAVLTGVHLEMSALEYRDVLRSHTDGADYVHLADALEKTDAERPTIWRKVLSLAGLGLKPR